MELLCLKANDLYLRITGQGYALVGVNKASVYPMKAKNEVKQYFSKFKEELPQLIIVKLTVTEEKYEL